MAPTITKVLGAKFNFSIKNNSLVTVVIALFAAYFNTAKVATVVDAVTHVATSTIDYSDATEIKAAGYTCDAVLDDGEILPDVICTAGNEMMSIRQMKNFVKHWGHTIVDMEIEASNVDAFAVVMQVIKQTPLEGTKADYVRIASYKSTNQFDQLKVIIPNINIEAAFDTLALLPVKAGRELDITLNFV